MKYALISPNESIQDGVRIAQVCSKRFPVAPPLYWIKCNDNVFAETHYYHMTDGILEIPVPKNPNQLDIETPQVEGPPSSVA